MFYEKGYFKILTPAESGNSTVIITTAITFINLSQISARPSKEDSKDDHMVSRLLRDAQVNLLWTMRGDTLDWKRISKNTLVSRFPRAYFTTKVGVVRMA